MHVTVTDPRSERVRAATPTGELARRWSAVRAAMKREGADVLVVHNHVDHIGGYVKYFCDLPSYSGYPLSVIFPVDDAMTLVMHGPNGVVTDISPDDDELFYGVKRIASTWSFASASYTATYDAAQIARTLQPYARGRIGIVGMSQIPHLWIKHLEMELPHAVFFDAADIVDPIKAIKSAYELAAIRETLTLQRRTFEAALDAIQPGRREWEVVAAASAASRLLGSNGGLLMLGSAPPGQPAMMNPPRHQNRVLQQGDRMVLLVEVAGVEGYFGEVGRTVVLGSADDALLEDYEFARKAWRHAVAALRPGTSARNLFADYNSFMQEHGRPPEQRLHSHGQGYDLVERPFVRSDETMTIGEGMFMVVHPMYVRNATTVFLCDNVFVGADEVSGPMHGIEQKVFEV